MKRQYKLLLILVGFSNTLLSQNSDKLSKPSSPSSFFLRSKKGYDGSYDWKIKKVSEVKESGGVVTSSTFKDTGWYNAIVPGTVLNSLVSNGIYPEPYFGDNNRKSRQLIPDLAEAGNAYYHYWFKTSFNVPSTFTGKRTWLKLHGINYRCEIWLNGNKLGTMAGMFNSQAFDITGIIKSKTQNILAVSVQPVDIPGSNSKPKQDRPGAFGENRNGGDGEIGKNVSMLMSVGWDFTAPDGIRDRNTGIWKDVEIYTTGDVILEHPFVKTKLALPDTSHSTETISVEVYNATNKVQSGILSGFIKQNNTRFSQHIVLEPNERKTVVFDTAIYKQLHFKNPRLWWPLNKGDQYLYDLELKFTTGTGQLSHSIAEKFGVREISSDQKSPDSSRRFYVNGFPIFIRGTNWVPEAMLRNSETRTAAELRYTKQAGINFIRLWGGGIAESDYFYELCDRYGILVWTEFWITGDTRFPKDTALYFKNMTATVKRLRNHASQAYYVSANESTEMPGAGKLIAALAANTGYQVQSECCGVHDGSPYKYENPMQYFENTASPRGSRIDGFNPEYGTPCLPTVEALREMIPEKDLWPINDSVWKYLDGGGFHQMITKYKQAVDEFGTSSSIEEFAKKAQFVGALNFRAIWEVWNYNKFNFGDRFASGFLFWYHNSPVRQTSGRMYDWSLEPTAALYYSQNGLQPLHPQFDYLKNTVSVYNDYRKVFTDYTIEAEVYNMDSKKIFGQSAKINIPYDGAVKDAIKINFPATTSSVHFIKLLLKDKEGKLVSNAFYWRSNDVYKGAWTMTGPAVSGFNDINKMRAASIKTTATLQSNSQKNIITVNITNNAGSISFFTQLKLQKEDGSMIKPAFYSDNFFCLLPGETKKINIEFADEQYSGKKIKLITEAFNAAPVTSMLIKK